MSTQYPGGFITKSPVAPTSTAASGIWTVDQALQYVKAGTWPSPPIFIEDLFSTYLYTGNGSTQTITNNVNLSTGGLVWIKSRSNSYNHFLMDTARGAQSQLSTNDSYFANTAAPGYDLTAFTSTGFTLGPPDKTGINNNGTTIVSWSFRKQPKFFDVVTYTGTGSATTIAHSLGSVPGCIIVKQIAPNSTNWQVYHRSLANTQYMVLNSTAAVATGTTRWNSTTPTDSVFSIGTDATVNTASSTYVAYLFAHDAGGFPANGGGSTNGISCGSFSFAAGKATVNLGYEVQYLLLKRTDSLEQWFVFDIMRGMTASLTGNNYLGPNTSTSENDFGSITQPTATGFYLDWSNNGVTTGNYIYIAIRRGPMKTPTVGTSVFAPVTYAGTDTDTNVTTNIVPSLTVIKGRGTQDWFWTDMLRGPTKNLRSNTSGAEAFDGTVTQNNTGFTLGVSNGFTNAGVNFISYSFLRAPGFFDEVCYTGTGVAMTVSHNLNVVPEIIIVKNRVRNANWRVYVSALGPTKYLDLNGNGYASTNTNAWNDTSPTASVFTVGTGVNGNAAGEGIVAYLFATLAGISKVGSYTGTGATQTISCGFTGGARWVMVKRTDVDGDWYVWDSVRGMVAGTDPSLSVNAATAEVNANSVYTTTGGFQIVSTAAGINASGGTYIFLAIA